MRLNSVQMFFERYSMFFTIDLKDIKKGIKNGLFKDANNMTRDDFEFGMTVYGISDKGVVFEAKEHGILHPRMLYATYNTNSYLYKYLRSL